MMNADTAFGPLLAALLGLLANFGLPLGLPPQPLDPAVERAAPDECLFYLGWSGYATPDAKSENQTEQFLAEAEVRQFIKALDSQLPGIFKNDSAGPEQQVVGDETPKIVRTLLTHPTAIFLSSFSMASFPPEVSGGIIVNAGDDLPALEASLTKLIGQLPAAPGAAAGGATETIGGVKCRQVPLPPGGPEVWWGSKGKYLMFGISKPGLTDLIAHMGDAKRAAPAWLTDARAKLKVDRVSQTSYVNVQAIAKSMGPAQFDAKTLPIWKALGGESIQTLTAVTGLNRTGMISRALIDCGGKPTGIFGMLGEKPLTTEDFKSAPADPTGAVVLRLPLTQVYDSILEIVLPADPDEREKMQANIDGPQAAIGISVRDHLLASLGDTICVYGPPAGAADPTGGMATISVSDRAKLQKVEKVLLTLLKGTLGQQPGVPKLKETTVGGQTIQSLETPGSPANPTWTITKDELVIGMSTKTVTDYLGRSAGAKSLGTNAAVAAILRRPTGPSLLTYFDMKDSIDSAYGVIENLLLPVGNANLKTAGVPLVIPNLPSLSAIKPHLRPSITLATRTSGGIMIERVQTVPLVGDLVTATPLVGLIMPAINAARGAAGGGASINNPQQIGLSLLDDDAVDNALPGAAIVSKDGKP